MKKKFFFCVLIISVNYLLINCDDNDEKKNKTTTCTSSISLLTTTIGKISEHNIITLDERKNTRLFLYGDIYDNKFTNEYFLKNNDNNRPANYYMVAYKNELPYKIEKYYNNKLIASCENVIKDNSVLQANIKYIPYAPARIKRKKAKLIATTNKKQHVIELNNNTKLKVLEEKIAFGKPKTKSFVVKTNDGKEGLILENGVSLTHKASLKYEEPFKGYLYKNRKRLLNDLKVVKKALGKNETKTAVDKLKSMLNLMEHQDDTLNISYRLNPVIVACCLWLGDIYKINLTNIEEALKINEKLVELSYMFFDKYKCASTLMFYRAYSQVYTESIDFDLINVYLSLLDVKIWNTYPANPNDIYNYQKGKYLNKIRILQTSTRIDVRYLFLLRLAECYSLLADREKYTKTLKKLVVLIDSSEPHCIKGMDVDFRVIALDKLVLLYSKEKSEDNIKALLEHLTSCYEELKNVISNPARLANNSYYLLYYIAKCYDELNDNDKALEAYNKSYDTLKRLHIFNDSKIIGLKNQVKRAIIRLSN